MEIPYDRWFPVISGRRSRRDYRQEPLPVEMKYTLKKTCRDFRPFEGIRAELLTENVSHIFNFIAASYGTIRGVQSLFAFIGDIKNPQVHAQLGFTGQGLVLEATALGLGTCWVTGTFRMSKLRQLIPLEENERIMAVSPLGFATLHIPLRERIMGGMINHAKRKPLRSLISGIKKKEWPDWMENALEAARLAPSAMNRQPWRFHVEKDSITFYHQKGLLDRHTSSRLDCGIAMLNMEVAALNRGIKGRWEFLNSPEVARFHF
jgi:nitroreductase